MNVYAESSAVLAWLLGEKSGDSVREVLRRVELVISSDLTLIECDRVLIRAVATGQVDEAAAADGRAHLNRAARLWHLWRISTEVIERARRPFAAEPIRTLDAIHLATALAARSAVPSIDLLSLDDRIRESGKQLGFRTLP